MFDIFDDNMDIKDVGDALAVGIYDDDKEEEAELCPRCGHPLEDGFCMACGWPNEEIGR